MPVYTSFSWSNPGRTEYKKPTNSLVFLRDYSRVTMRVSTQAHNEYPCLIYRGSFKPRNCVAVSYLAGYFPTGTSNIIRILKTSRLPWTSFHESGSSLVAKHGQREATCYYFLDESDPSRKDTNREVMRLSWLRREDHRGSGIYVILFDFLHLSDNKQAGTGP